MPGKIYKQILMQPAREGLEKICQTGDKKLAAEIADPLESIRRDPLHVPGSTFIISGYDPAALQAIEKYYGTQIEKLSLWKHSFSEDLDVDMSLQRLEIGLYGVSISYYGKPVNPTTLHQWEREERDLVLSSIDYIKDAYQLILSLKEIKKMKDMEEMKDVEEVFITSRRISVREIT